MKSSNSSIFVMKTMELYIVLVIDMLIMQPFFSLTQICE